jgi:tetratricopeptide (TPR) repeat protein
MGVEEVVRLSLDLYNRGEWAEAEELVRAGLERFPEDGELWQLGGLLRHGRGDFRGARGDLETASVLVPLDATAQCALAECYVRTGRRELARGLYRHLAGLRRCPTALLPTVAAGLGGLGEDRLALETCREFSRREPGSPEAFVGMAFYMRRLGEPAEAIIPVAARAHELAPGVATYRILLATLLSQGGRHHEASDLLSEVPPETIGCQGCLRRMGAIFHRAGEHVRAAACERQRRCCGGGRRPGPSGGASEC